MGSEGRGFSPAVTGPSLLFPSRPPKASPRSEKCGLNSHLVSDAIAPSFSSRGCARRAEIFMPTKQLLIIGAGPYGLAAAAYAKHLGIDFAILGKPMEFWRDQMPQGMLLRSSGTGNLDPFEIKTLQRYLESKGIIR